MGLHEEDQTVCMTKTCGGYTWRSTDNVTESIQVTHGTSQEVFI